MLGVLTLWVRPMLIVVLEVLWAVALFGGGIGLLALWAIRQNRNYAFQHPQEPFSAGVDEAWTGAGPPPTEQVWREAGLRQFAREIRNGHVYQPMDTKRAAAKIEADLDAAAAFRAARRAADEAPR